MFNPVRLSRYILNVKLCRGFADNTGQKDAKNLKWDLYAGVLVERLPIISKSLNAIEEEFQALLWQKEFEGSLKSNHELKHERDLLQAELIKKGEVEIDLDESASKQTAQDLKDAYSEEFKNFKLASRKTEADIKQLKSINRALDETLYLLTKQVVGDKKIYTIPEGKRIENENMRQAAERVLKEACGTNTKVTFYGNAPCAFYKYKYPSSLKKESIGAKVFLYRTSLQKGNIEMEKSKTFEWQTKKEVIEKIKGTQLEILQKLLF
ncbi:39S ribosomal protein L46, mitochondrial [Condylostylus longicornis]|uniref:39S ribosomal protein L46, mitochondrial n=1 Tax=Condylostylus longicornis TaxID=2530218 RepID=UPI00244DDD6F|nr:39S ribosomal protein L46, mitochondrial [Condylostylus longicornis]